MSTKTRVESDVNDSDLHVRKLWKEGSSCKIYSRSKRSWYKGKIIAIYNDAEGEWLKVRYNKHSIKHIQRLCKDIKSDPNDESIKILLTPKLIANKSISYKNMSLNTYIERRKFLDEILICGYLRLYLFSIPSIINKLICKCYHKEMDIDEFTFETELGTGTFGRVLEAKHKKTLKKYAIKRLDKKRIMEMQQEKAIKNERHILSEIKHPFIINMLSTFDNPHFIYLIFELLPMGCEFFDLLKTYDRLNITQTVFYASQIVLIFEYLHSKHIVYRDLKPENLMYTSDGYLKLIDFGFSKHLADKSPISGGNEYETYTVCGTPDYLAPEILLNNGHSFAVDWWALGVLIFEMYQGYTPFDHENVVHMYTLIMNHNEQNNRRILANIDNKQKDLKNIISGFLCVNPRRRLGSQSYQGNVDDIKSHPFFSIIDWNKIYHKQYTNTPKHSPIYGSTSSYPTQPISQGLRNFDLNSNTHLQKPLAVNNTGGFLYDF
mmetsp:Transcript_23773/g.20800  ORF Transcript_23773/g.20800 Transcript_23773/m.20800 type:complete len:491 (-) Transcript_23773:209-1681(-)